MDLFFREKDCARCNTDLEGVGRTLSQMNMDIICVNCKDEERKHPYYKKAKDAELEQIKLGNYNYKGLFSGKTYPFGVEVSNKK